MTGILEWKAQLENLLESRQKGREDLLVGLDFAIESSRSKAISASVNVVVES